MKNYVFGDTGGHGFTLLQGLRDIGLNMETLKLPEDVRVIHLGDLIHKGPTSEDILAMVDGIMKVNGDNWLQLLGNHEFQHIKGSPYFWRCDCSTEAKELINHWWDTKKALAAFGLPGFTSLKPGTSLKPKFTVPDKGLLFTHAGVTRQFWTGRDSIADPVVFADLINASSVKIITRPGIMLANPYKTNINPGPVWALASDEVFNSWTDTDMPFIQVHGHTTPYGWMYKKWFPNTSKWFRDSTTLNVDDRISITEVANSLLLGVDPGFSQRVDLAAQPHLYFES